MIEIEGVEIERCPFCQSEDLMLCSDEPWFTYVACCDCGSRGPNVEVGHYGDAVVTWNSLSMLRAALEEDT